MLVENVIVETSIANSKARKLPCVSIRISATLNTSSNQAILKQFLIEEASVSTQVSDQVTDLSPNRSI